MRGHVRMLPAPCQRHAKRCFNRLNALFQGRR